MKRKRLDRDLKWGFQYFPYYQTHFDLNIYRGLVSVILLTDGEYYYWDFPKAGKTAVCGKGMVWLQLYPDNCKRLITAMYLPQKKTVCGIEYPYSLSALYVDVAEGIEYDQDGVAAYIDKYLDVKLTPQGDIITDDRDELEEALKSGDISEEQYKDALTECDLIIAQLGADIEKTEKQCSDILDLIFTQIDCGLQPIKHRISKQKISDTPIK